ncbi:unnamed protein product [Penicillium pancosmium]
MGQHMRQASHQHRQSGPQVDRRMAEPESVFIWLSDLFAHSFRFLIYLGPAETTATDDAKEERRRPIHSAQTATQIDGHVSLVLSLYISFGEGQGQSQGHSPRFDEPYEHIHPSLCPVSLFVSFFLVCIYTILLTCDELESAIAITRKALEGVYTTPYTTSLD